MIKRKITIEYLALLTKRGFDQTATKEEFKKIFDQMVTKEEFRREVAGIKSELKELKERVMHLSADVSRLKEEVRRDDLFVEDLLRRMRVVEKRIGVTK